MFYLGKIKKIHFVGIGGSGMSGLAEVLHNLGFIITGSDIRKTQVTKRLEQLGIKVFYSHRAENVRDKDLVVKSSAIPPFNIEILEAKRLNIPVIPRAEMLGELMRMKYSIAVSGSHGKTTTTYMIGEILEKAGKDPTIVVGGRIKETSSGAKLGNGIFMVAEADESDRSFLKLFPTIVVVTNIDLEHLDHYGTLKEIKDAFVEFANKIPFYGFCVLCLDDKNVKDIIPYIEKKVITYGFSNEADFVARNLKFSRGRWIYEVFYRGRKLGDLELKIIGKHNVLNSLASFAVAWELDIPFDVIKEALMGYGGVSRRFEIKGMKRGVLFVDDYGHHPTEIKVTLEGAKEWWKGRIFVVFQPHRYTRTYYLWQEFAKSFDNADLVLITKIYPAGEQPIEGVSAKLIYDEMRKFKKNVFYFEDWDEMEEFVLKNLKEGDLFLTLGAGDIWKFGERVKEKF